MQSIAVTPALHGSPGEFVNNYHLAVFNDIVNITLKGDMGLQRLIEVVKIFYIGRVIEIINLQQFLTK